MTSKFSPDYMEISNPLLLFRKSPEYKVLPPTSPDISLSQSIAPADPPPPVRLLMTDSEGLGPWLVLREHIAAASVTPPVTTGIHSPLHDMAPVSGGVPDTQLGKQNSFMFN